jgi:hypothetical protein
MDGFKTLTGEVKSRMDKFATEFKGVMDKMSSLGEEGAAAMK